MKEEKTNEAMMNFLKAAGGNIPDEAQVEEVVIKEEVIPPDEPEVLTKVEITGQDGIKTGIKSNA